MTPLTPIQPPGSDASSPHSAWPTGSLLGRARKGIAAPAPETISVGDLTVVYGSALLDSPEMALLARRGTVALGDVLNGPGRPVEAYWDAARDGFAEAWLVLRLAERHPSGDADARIWVTGVIRPDEARDDLRLLTRVNRLWSDLLQMRIDLLFEHKPEASGAAEE